MVSKCDIYYNQNLIPKGSILKETTLISCGTLGYSFIQYLFEMYGYNICPFISKRKAKELGVI